MEKISDYQKKQLQAIHNFYNKINKQPDANFSMTDVVIAWFTEGHAEMFRRKNLRHRALAIS